MNEEVLDDVRRTTSRLFNFGMERLMVSTVLYHMKAFGHSPDDIIQALEHMRKQGELIAVTGPRTAPALRIYREVDYATD